MSSSKPPKPGKNLTQQLILFLVIWTKVLLTIITYIPYSISKQFFQHTYAKAHNKKYKYSLYLSWNFLRFTSIKQVKKSHLLISDRHDFKPLLWLIKWLKSLRILRLFFAGFLSFLLVVNMAAIDNPIFAEGSYQFGPSSGTTQSNQGLIEYNSPFADATGATGISPAINRPIYVDIKTAGEVINVSACGNAFTDDWEVDIYYVGSDMADYTGTRSSYPPASGSLVFGQAGNAGTSAVNFRGQGTFGTNTNNANCDNFNMLTTGNMDLTTPAAPYTSDGSVIKYTTTQAGVYEIRLQNVTQNTNATPPLTIFNQFDISVTPNTSTNPNPQTKSGRVWSYLWAFNAGAFTANASTDGDFYVVVPGGTPGTNFVWKLDLNLFAGYVYELVANDGGVDSPNAAGNNVRGLSVPISGNSVSPKYRQYLSYPDKTFVRPTQAPSISNLKFEDNAGEDNTFTPGLTGGVQDTGYFKFTSSAVGTYEIIIDTNQDGTYGSGDVQLRGNTDASGNVTALWNGKDNSGTTLPPGTYNSQIKAIVGEYHFIAGDVETSGGSGLGLTVSEATGPSSTSNTPVYWDDKTILGASGTTTLPNGVLGGRHTWGTTSTGGGQGSNGSSWGDIRYIDTFVYGNFTIGNIPAIIADGDDIDFGDAPDTYGTNKTNSSAEGIGASQILSNTILLGTNATDKDTDGQPSVNADSDDTNGTVDDEDGVTSFNTLVNNATSYNVTVKVKNTSGANAYLGGWIDFNRNDKFEASEGVVQTIATGTNGDVNLNWTGLSGLVSGTTYARFRINNDPLTTSDFIGGGRNGEVEDYKLSIIPNVDYGDAPDTGTGTGAGNYQTTSSDGGASHGIINTLKLGTNVADADDGTLQNASATADDTTGTDDEDGVTFPNTLTTSNTSYSATVNVTNTTGSAANLVGWIDLNKNGQFEATEGVAQSIPNNASPQNVTLNWTSITGLTVGNTYARFRLSDSASLTTSTPNGALGNGEVEDYQLTITNIDYGDAPDTGTGTGAGNYQTTSSDGGANHTIISTLKLGTNVADADDGTLQNASATADDTTGTDDEDGVTFSNTLTTSNTSYSATVNVTNTTGSAANLVGWIDLNKNGQFEATEGVAQSIPNNASPQNVTLNWTSITGLTVGNTYARFRLSDSASLTTSTPNGAVGNGEVEDYQLSIQMSNPNVLLVKRITKINNATTTNGGDNLAAYINEASNPYDDNTLDNPAPPAKPDTDKWPDPNTFLIGGVNGGKIIPGDVIEYTIYFLSGGNVTAKNTLFCDLVPANTTFNPTAFNTGVTPDPSGSGDRGIVINLNGSIKAYSNADDGDIAQYFLPGVEPTTKYPKIDCDGDPNTTIPNTNGAVVVNLGDVPNATAPGTPTNSYGFVRFRAQVN